MSYNKMKYAVSNITVGNASKDYQKKIYFFIDQINEVDNYEEYKDLLRSINDLTRNWSPVDLLVAFTVEYEYDGDGVTYFKRHIFDGNHESIRGWI